MKLMVRTQICSTLKMSLCPCTIYTFCWFLSLPGRQVHMGLIIQLLVLPPSAWRAGAYGSDYPVSVSSFSVRVDACMHACMHACNFTISFVAPYPLGVHPHWCLACTFLFMGIRFYFIFPPPPFVAWLVLQLLHLAGWKCLAMLWPSLLCASLPIDFFTN